MAATPLAPFGGDPDPEDTNDILGRARQGDRDALNSLYLRYEARILAWVRSQMGPLLGRSLQDSDLMQEVMRRSLSQIAVVKDAAHLRRLFMLLAEQVAIDEHRRLTADKRDKGREADLDGDARFDPPARDTRPSQKVQQKEYEGIYAECLHRLSESHRRVLQLRHLAGLSFRDIGAEMGRSEGAAAMLLGRAEKELRALLVARGFQG